MLRPPHRPGTRAGFTLVELLVVIVVIAILIGLLLPAVSYASRRAQIARTASDIQSLAQSLESFKSMFGDYPPSRIVLVESGFYNTADTTKLSAMAATSWYAGAGPNTNSQDMTYGELAQRSLRYLRKFFPRATFSTSGPVWSSGPGLSQFYDFNGNGNFDGSLPIYLEGHECLAFFLGGIPNPNGTGTFAGLGGFSKNPTNPFVSESTAANRIRPFFEFKSDRLFDEDGDGIPGYLDPLGVSSEGRPYVYFSAYGNNGYDPNDANTGSSEDTGTSRQYFLGGVGKVSPAPNPYCSSPASPTVGTVKWVNPQSYQIISPGLDRNYGVGGQYQAQSTNERLPADSFRSGDLLVREQDNIVNFTNGTLD